MCRAHGGMQGGEPLVNLRARAHPVPILKGPHGEAPASQVFRDYVCMHACMHACMYVCRKVLDTRHSSVFLVGVVALVLRSRMFPTKTSRQAHGDLHLLKKLLLPRCCNTTKQDGMLSRRHSGVACAASFSCCATPRPCLA